MGDCRADHSPCRRAVPRVTILLSGRQWGTKVVQDGVFLGLMSPTSAGQQQGDELSALLHMSSSGQANSCPGKALLSPMSAEEPGVSSPRDPPAREKLVFDHLKSLSFHAHKDIRVAGLWRTQAPSNPWAISNQVSSRCSEMQGQH